MLQGQIQLTKQPLRLVSQRPFQLQQKMLEGKSLAEIPPLVGLIYGLCQQAQSSASSLILQCAEQTENPSVSEPLLRLEMIKEHFIAFIQHVCPFLGVELSQGISTGIGLWMREAKRIEREETFDAPSARVLKAQIEQRVVELLGDAWSYLATCSY